jgi:hypothetical protein
MSKAFSMPVDVVLEAEFLHRGEADAVLLGAAADDDEVDVGPVRDEHADGFEEIFIAAMGLHARDDADGEGVFGQAEARAAVGQLSCRVEAVRVDGAGDNVDTVFGEGEFARVMVVRHLRGDQEPRGAVEEFLVAVCLRQAFAVVARAHDGNAGFPRGFRRDGVVVVEVAVDEVVVALLQEMLEFLAVLVVLEGVAVFVEVEALDGLDAAFTRVFDNLVDGRAAVRRAGEVDVHTQVAQGHAEAQGRLCGAGPFEVAEEMEDSHAAGTASPA